MNTITKQFYGQSGELIDPTSVVLEDYSAAFGVKRLDTGATVVPVSSAMTRTSLGVYTYSFTDPAPNLIYEYWVKFVVSGNTFYSGANLNSAATVAGYTLAEMTDELGIMLNELNQAGNEPFEYTPSMGVNLLNKGQDTALTMLPGSYFTGLHIADKGIALDADGSFVFSDLSTAMYSAPLGLMGVRLNGDIFARRISFSEYLELTRNNVAFSSDDPSYYIAGDRVTVYPASSTDTVDAHYMREPVRMALDPYGNRDDDVSCELAREVQNIIMDLAAARGYKIGHDFDRSIVSRQLATKSVEEITARLDSTDSIRYSVKHDISAFPFVGNGGINFWTGR